MEKARAKRNCAKQEGVMKSWYKVSFSKDDISARKNEALAGAFEAIFVRFPLAKDAAMFEAVGSFGCVYFLSPGAARIALRLIVQYGGVECEAPKRSEVRGGTAHQEFSDTVPFAD